MAAVLKKSWRQLADKVMALSHCHENFTANPWLEMTREGSSKRTLPSLRLNIWLARVGEQRTMRHEKGDSLASDGNFVGMLIKNHEIDAPKKRVCLNIGGSLKTVGFLEESSISSGFSQSLNKNDNWQICKITLASHVQSEIHLIIAFSNPFILFLFPTSH